MLKILYVGTLPSQDFAKSWSRFGNSVKPGETNPGHMTYKVTVTLDKVDPRFMWNMTATVNIVVK